MMAAALVCFITLVQFQYIANRSVQKDVVAYLDTSEDQTLRKNLGLGPDSIQIDLDGLSAGISPSSTVTSTDNFESVPVLAARTPSPSKSNRDAYCAPQVHGMARIWHSSAMQKVRGAVKKTPEKAKSFGHAVSFRTKGVVKSLKRSRTSQRLLDCLNKGSRCGSNRASPSKTGSPGRRTEGIPGSGRSGERPQLGYGPSGLDPSNLPRGPHVRPPGATGNSHGGRGDTGATRWQSQPNAGVGSVDSSDVRRRIAEGALGQGSNPEPASGVVMDSAAALEKYGRAKITPEFANAAWAEVDRQKARSKSAT